MTVCSEKRRLPACLPPRLEISRRKLPDGLLLRDVRAARGETSSDIIAQLLTRSMQRRELESDRVSGNERSDRFIYRTRRIVALHRGAENGSNGRDGRAERGAWIIKFASSIRLSRVTGIGSERVSFSGGPPRWREVARISDRREVVKGTGTRAVK